MKWHGAGNDFVVLDSRESGPIVTQVLAKALGDRHCGVGFDQLAEIHSPDGKGVSLDFWNSDGSRAGACGNATRCVARFLLDESGAEALEIRTERGALPVRLVDGAVHVNMGPPQLDWCDIPLAREVDRAALPIEGAPVAVGMGNPHAVFFVQDAEAVALTERGPEVEHHALFPERTNVEFVQVRARDEMRMRVWERGAGVTLACGSGACAALVAAVERGLVDRRARIEVDGGWLELEWRADGVWMTGPTAHIFTAELTQDFLAGL